MPKIPTTSHSLRFAAALAFIPVLFFLPCHTQRPPNIAGTWPGSISSPAGANCGGNVVVIVSQSGTNFTGEFTLERIATGTFRGALSGNKLSGVFTENRADGCTGTGDFSGKASRNSITVSIPTITSSNSGCVFCQQNTITLSR